jgi:hypothetical protein
MPGVGDRQKYVCVSGRLVNSRKDTYKYGHTSGDISSKSLVVGHN